MGHAESSMRRAAVHLTHHKTHVLVPPRECHRPSNARNFHSMFSSAVTPTQMIHWLQQLGRPPSRHFPRSHVVTSIVSALRAWRVTADLLDERVDPYSIVFDLCAILGSTQSNQPTQLCRVMLRQNGTLYHYPLLMSRTNQFTCL